MSYSNELTLSVWQSNNRQKEGKCEEDAQIQKSNFLIVEDYVKFAKDNKIPVGPGRGSSAGSLISYLLNITEIDSIKYNLFRGCKFE